MLACKCKHTHAHVCKHQRSRHYTHISQHTALGTSLALRKTEKGLAQRSPRDARTPSPQKATMAPWPWSTALQARTGSQAQQSQQRHFRNTCEASEGESHPGLLQSLAHPSALLQGLKVWAKLPRATSNPGLSPARHPKTFVFHPFSWAVSNPVANLR